MRARIAALLTLALVASPRPAEAIPAFARKYRTTCATCHAPVPRLNAFGEQFAANGFVLAIGEPPRDIIATGDPLEMKTQFTHVFINGRSVGMNSKHTELYERFASRPVVK